VQVPKAYETHVGPASVEVTACISKLEKQLLSESLEARKEAQVLAESELSNPMVAFEREYGELVHHDKLPDDLLGTAKAVMADQGLVFKFAWIRAKAQLESKAEQNAATRTATAEARAQADMEVETLPSRELIQDLVNKQVAAALKKERAQASASASASAGGGNDGKAKAKSKAKPDSAQGGARGGYKGKQKPKQQPNAQKNAQRN
jgi:hypothetical protein